MVASEQFLQTVTDQIKLVRDEIGKVIVGHDDVVEGVIIALVAGGHVLLEGVPGLGKTTLLRTLGRAMHLDDSRIQFTPDLMPADIVGSMVLEADSLGSKELRFQPGRSSRIWCWRTRSTARRRARNPRCSRRCRSGR